MTKIQYFILFRDCVGEAWFDDVTLSLAPFRISGERLQPGLYGGNSLDGFVKFSLPATWTASVLRQGQEVFRLGGEGSVARFAWGGTDGAGQLLPGGKYTLRVVASDTLLEEQIVHERQVVTPTGSGKGCVAWTESSMLRILPTTVPAVLQARIALAGGEWESFQVALRTAPGIDLRDCRVKLSSLQDGHGHVISDLQDVWERRVRRLCPHTLTDAGAEFIQKHLGVAFINSLTPVSTPQ